jgi:hypothetical protein
MPLSGQFKRSAQVLDPCGCNLVDAMQKPPVPPPVYRPHRSPRPLQPKTGMVAPSVPPVYRPLRPPAVGAIQRTIDSAAEELRQGGIITVKNSHLTKPFLTKHGIKKTDLAAIQKRMTELRDATPKAAKVEPDDITSEYNVAYACVLQAIIYLKVTAWGKSSPKDLHTLIWTDQAKKQYRQYDDDKVIPSLLTAVGLSAVEIEAGTTVQDVEDTFGAGKYFVSVKGSVEDHSLILDSGAWKEYNQTGSGSGFKAARTDKNAEVKSVYK